MAGRGQEEGSKSPNNSNRTAMNLKVIQINCVYSITGIKQMIHLQHNFILTNKNYKQLHVLAS